MVRVGKVVDVLSLLALIGGMVTSLGFGVQQFASGLELCIRNKTNQPDLRGDDPACHAELYCFQRARREKRHGHHQQYPTPISTLSSSASCLLQALRFLN